MSLIAPILPMSNILLDIEATSKKRLFEQVGLLFENQHGVARSQVFDSLFARERLGSTGLGYGVAIPHGRIKNISDPVAAFIRLKQAVTFDAPDAIPVDLLIILLVPEEATQQHLEILADIAQILSHPQNRDALRHLTSQEDVHGILSQPLNITAN